MATYFFRCVDCHNVIVGEPAQLHAEPIACPACLAPGAADDPAPFERVEVVE